MSDVSIFVRDSDVHDYSIHFTGTIDQLSMSKLIETLYAAERKILAAKNTFAEYFRIKKRQPIPAIKLYISSYGGYIYPALGAVDIIQKLKVPVHTIGVGYVASAATLLHLAGTRRMMTKNTFMLIHQLRSSIWGTFHQIQDEYNNLAQLHEHIVAMYSVKTKISKDELKEILKSDVFWNAATCQEKWLVDEII